MPDPVLFSAKELNYLHDRDFLLTKQRITQKIFDLFIDTEKIIKRSIDEIDFDFPQSVLKKSGKVSKGENYKNLPYLVLDLPRYFTREGSFNFRIMFWWGHFFSATLMLSGNILDLYRKPLISNLQNLIDNEFYFCHNHTPWEYDFQKENFILMKAENKELLKNYIYKREFVKFSQKTDLDNWHQLSSFSLNTFKVLIYNLK
ncbi:MAG: hypothetical protein ACNS62_24270 [Candidatus Cyclobacteriaceae bacterium M3_2C_046]